MHNTIIQRHIIKSRLIRKFLFADKTKKKRNFYLERFREYKRSNFDKNTIVKLLPLLAVLAFLYVLISQNLFFGAVLSGSMEPTFKRGDLVLMQSLYGEPAVGDIIMFIPMKGMEPITHRITSIDKYKYIRTKGDANPKEDDWIVRIMDIKAKSVIIFGKPIVLPGFGTSLVSRAENFSIVTKLTKEQSLDSLFQQFRSYTPLIIFIMLVIYIFMVVDSGDEEKHRSGRKKN
ncbi:MAG: signal peptidase I [Candidatus Methanoperedenaceae archaeon]|nr:MAG: signal peptidase I [Candidatus Methanoperedenaceae archaeon]